jgi:putative SOS response-associated peptidase YedK
MCGRYAMWGVDLIGQRFLIVDPTLGFRSHFNIAPTSENPVVVSAEDGNHIRMMKWGLIHHWAKDPKFTHKPINARAESLLNKPMFRELLDCNRCIVPANGFFEWKKTDVRKEPFFIHIKDKALFGFAGLYDAWFNPDGEVVFTYSIVTTEANEVMRPLHDRMPVILREENEHRWLSGDHLEEADLLEILTPYSSSETIAYPVSTAVNSTTSDGIELIRPIVTLDLGYNE